MTEPKLENLGTCYLCQQDVSHRAIKKHLAKCLEKDATNSPSSKKQIFLIKVSSGKLFWLFFEVNGSALLEDVDDFLRHTWLECCGHMSQFVINREQYDCDEGMEEAVQGLLTAGDKFEYEYDFGSTTYLEGVVISTRPGKLAEPVRLLARNHFPAEILCATCQALPVVVCSFCGDCFCKKCKKRHKTCEGEEYMMPVVNSPRMGVCGYTGEIDY